MEEMQQNARFVMAGLGMMIDFMLKKKPDATCEEIKQMIIDLAPGYASCTIFDAMMPMVYELATRENNPLREQNSLFDVGAVKEQNSV